MSLNPGLGRQRYFFIKAFAENVTDYLFRCFRQKTRGWGGILTSGSSTTITGAVGLDIKPFGGVVVGDYLEIRYGGTTYFRRVATKVSDNEITVDTAIDLSNGTSGWDWFQRIANGSADSDGWVNIGYDTNRTVFFQIVTLVNPLDIVIQERGGDGLSLSPITVFNRVLVVGTDTSFAIPIGEDAQQVRVGIRSATIATDPDDITVYLGTRKVR